MQQWVANTSVYLSPLTSSVAADFDQVGENQGVGGQSRPWGLDHPFQCRPGEPATGQERRGDADVLQRVQYAEVN